MYEQSHQTSIERLHTWTVHRHHAVILENIVHLYPKSVVISERFLESIIIVSCQ